MKHAITLNEVAGYVTEKNIWKLLLDLSSADGNLFLCSPEQIEIDENHFTLVDRKKKRNSTTPFAPPEHNGSKTETTEVWALGAMAFYALMGVDILEGKGGEAQTEAVNIPRISSTHCSTILSDTIYHCLSYTPSQRPTMAQLRNIAAERVNAKELPPRQLSLSSGEKYKNSLVKFWPEEMCSTLILILMLFLPFSSTAQYQQEIPEEMNALVQRCKSLRNPVKTNQITMDFTYDSLWTLMDELSIDRQGECTTKQKVKTLKLNDLCYRIIKLNTGVTNTGSRFRNGMDKRYNYSFIEVTVKKGSQVNYDITGRSGKQIFAFVPYNDKSRIRVSITRNGKDCAKEVVLNHVTYLFVDDAVSSNDILHLKIENLSNEHISFVIINYNSRKRQ